MWYNTILFQINPTRGTHLTTCKNAISKNEYDSEIFQNRVEFFSVEPTKVITIVAFCCFFSNTICSLR